MWPPPKEAGEHADPLQKWKEQSDPRENGDDIPLRAEPEPNARSSALDSDDSSDDVIRASHVGQRSSHAVALDEERRLASADNPVHDQSLTDRADKRHDLADAAGPPARRVFRRL
jgi:hypothetical protein